MRATTPISVAATSLPGRPPALRAAPAPRRRDAAIALLAAAATTLAILPTPAAAADPDPAAATDAADDLGHDPARAPVPGAVPGAPAPALQQPSSAGSITPRMPEHDGPGAGEVDDAPPRGQVRTADAGFPVRSRVAGTGEVSPDILLYGQGWGHSVGLSQFGAFAKALEGRSATDILTHYYTGTQVTTDQRATNQRIRAGITTNATATPVEALDGQVTWRICTPESIPAINGRVPAERCATWFTQSAGEQLTLQPLGGAAVATPNGVQTGTADPTALAQAAPADEQVAAPRGGLLVLRDGAPYRAYVTPEGRDAAQLPVARVDHGDTRIRAQSYAAPERVYTSGWRDLHLVGSAADQPDGHRLTIVQDVDSVERYLRGLAEVPSSWPEAALDAQAIAGRTYGLRGSRGGGCLCDRLSTAADQVFIGESKVEEIASGQPVGQRWAAAVERTRDRVLTFQGGLAETYYSSSFAGRSENVEDSWAYYRASRYQDPAQIAANPPLAYLRSVDDPWSLLQEVNGRTISNSRRDWTAAASNDAFRQMVNRDRTTPFVRIEGVRIAERTDGGTPRILRVTGVTGAGARETMSFRGVTTGDGRTLNRPVAGNTIRLELPLVQGGEPNARVSSSQIRRMGLAPFTDDHGTTHEYAISWAATAGVVQGVSGTRFAPGRDVTRGQMATFLNNTFSLPAAPAGADTFDDVTPGSTHHAAIEAIAAAGITQGYGDGTYRPGEAVSRQEMATFLTRAQGLRTTLDHGFRDVPTGSTHEASIAAVAAEGITAGCTDDRYCPREPVTRGQLATFVYRSVRG